MEKKHRSIWTVIGVIIAIILLLLWLTFAVWLDNEPEAANRVPIESPSTVKLR